MEISRDAVCYFFLRSWSKKGHLWVSLPRQKKGIIISQDRKWNDEIYSGIKGITRQGSDAGWKTSSRMDRKPKNYWRHHEAPSSSTLAGCHDECQHKRRFWDRVACRVMNDEKKDREKNWKRRKHMEGGEGNDIVGCRSSVDRAHCRWIWSTGHQLSFWIKKLDGVFKLRKKRFWEERSCQLKDWEKCW